MSKARIYTSVAILTSLIILAAVGFRAYQLNTEAVRIDTEHYAMGEWVSLDDTILSSRSSEFPGYSLKVKSAQVVSYNEYIEMYGLDKSKISPGLDEKSVVDVELEIRNEGNDKSGIPLMALLLVPERKNTYYIWRDELWLESEPNSKDVLFIATRVDSEYATHLPFTRNNFNPDQTAFKKPINDKSFSLVVSHAPVRKVIDVKV